MRIYAFHQDFFDDAGAIEIAFILDCRDLNKQKTGVSSNKKLLEPSLLCWNNKEFIKDELEGIKKLGIVSNRELVEDRTTWSRGQLDVSLNRRATSHHKRFNILHV